MPKQWSLFILLVLALPVPVVAQIPEEINYQGKVEVDGVPFDGVGLFNFAIVDSTGTTTFWSNDGTSINGNEPDNGVTVPVTKGFFTIKLGNTDLTNMSALPTSVFTHQNIFVRVWFSTDYPNFELLSPDTQIVSAGFAYKAQSVVDNTVTSATIQDGSVTNDDISSNTKIDAMIKITTEIVFKIRLRVLCFIRCPQYK